MNGVLNQDIGTYTQGRTTKASAGDGTSLTALPSLLLLSPSFPCFSPPLYTQSSQHAHLLLPSIRWRFTFESQDLTGDHRLQMLNRLRLIWLKPYTCLFRYTLLLSETIQPHPSCCLKLCPRKKNQQRRGVTTSKSKVINSMCVTYSSLTSSLSRSTAGISAPGPPPRHHRGCRNRHELNVRLLLFT